jgi:hypothetical protein
MIILPLVEKIIIVRLRSQGRAASFEKPGTAGSRSLSRRPHVG